MHYDGRNQQRMYDRSAKTIQVDQRSKRKSEQDHYVFVRSRLRWSNQHGSSLQRNSIRTCSGIDERIQVPKNK